MKTNLQIHNFIIANVASRNGARRLKAQRGQALVPVIFVMLIMTVIAVGFAVSAQREVRSSANFVAETQRFRAAQGALNYAMSALAQSSANGATYGVIAPMPDTDDSGWSQVGDAWVKIEAIDTGAYLNINNADIAALQKIPVLRDNSDLAAAILEWRTPPSTQGAPSVAGNADYYQQQQPPYSIKGAAYDTVEELLLIKGMTPAILYGGLSGGAVSSDTTPGSSSVTGGGQGTRQAGGKPPGTPTPSGLGGAGGQNGGVQTGGGQNGGGQTGGGQSGSGQNGGGQTAGGQSGSGQGAAASAPEDFSDIYSASTISLAQLLTTAARERNIAADGSARININTATQQDLTIKLGLTPRQARSLIGYRTPVSNTGGSGNGNGGGNGNGNGAGGNGGGQQGSGNVQPGGNVQGGGQAGAPSGQPGQEAPGGPSPRSAHRFLSRQAPPVPGGGGMNGGGNTSPGGMNGGGSNGGGGGGNTGSGGGTPNSGSSGGNTGSAPAPIFKTIADLLDVPGFTRTVMQQVADKVAIDDSPMRENVVNINTAPGEVLASVPGMDHATLTAILQYRQGGRAFQTLSDLFSIQDIGREIFKKIIPYLSAKSSVYYVRIKVRTSGQQGMYAAIGSIELKSDGAHILQWREVQRKPGWADWIPFQKLPAPTPSSGGAGSSSSASAGGASGQ